MLMITRYMMPTASAPTATVKTKVEVRLKTPW